MKYKLITEEVKICTNDVIKNPKGALYKVVGLSVGMNGFLDEQNLFIIPYPVDYTYTFNKKMAVNKISLISDQWEKKLM